MVGAADGDIEPDHVVLQGLHRIERRGAGMVRHARANPGDAGGASLLDRAVGRMAHDEMAEAVIAIDESGGRPVLDHPEARRQIDPARLDAPDVLRQAEDAVTVLAAQIGRRHQRGHSRRVRRLHADCAQRTGDKSLKRVERDDPSRYGAGPIGHGRIEIRKGKANGSDGTV